MCACIPRSGIEVGSSTVKEGKVYQFRQKQLDVAACSKGLKLCGVHAKKGCVEQDFNVLSDRYPCYHAQGLPLPCVLLFPIEN